MVVKNTKTKRNYFKIQKMSQETGIPESKIKEILTSKSKGDIRVSKDKLKYQSLKEAEEAFKKLPPESEDFPNALRAWEHFALIKVEKACTNSIMIEVLELCPEDGEAERRLIKKLAYNYGFTGKLVD